MYVGRRNAFLSSKKLFFLPYTHIRLGEQPWCRHVSLIDFFKKKMPFNHAALQHILLISFNKIHEYTII
jgi:hypothetical protein